MTYLCGLLRVRIQLSKNGYVAVETWYKIECELHIMVRDIAFCKWLHLFLPCFVPFVVLREIFMGKGVEK